MTRPPATPETGAGPAGPAPLLLVRLDELMLVGALAILIVPAHLGRARQAASAAQTYVAELSPDATLLARVTPQGSGVFDVEAGRFLYRLPGDTEHVDFSGDGSRLATGTSDGRVRLLEARTGRKIAEWDEDRVIQDLKFHPTGEVVAAALGDGTVLLLDPGRTDEIREIDSGLGGHVAIGFARASGELSTAGWSSMLEYDTRHYADRETGELVDGGGTVVVNYEVRFWDVRGVSPGARPRRAARALTEPNTGTFLAVSPDGNLVAVTANDPAEVHIVDVATGKRTHLATVPGHIWLAAFSRDGRTLVHDTQDGHLVVWDLGTGKERLRLPAYVSLEDDVEFLAGDEVLVTANTWGPVAYWDLRTGEALRAIEIVMPRFVPWLPAAAFGVWLVVWIAADIRRRRRPERPGGGVDRGVYVLAFAAAGWILAFTWNDAILHPGDQSLRALRDAPGLLLPTALITTVALAAVLSAAALLLGLTRRRRCRLVFTVPALLIALWAVAVARIEDWF